MDFELIVHCITCFIMGTILLVINSRMSKAFGSTFEESMTEFFYSLGIYNVYNGYEVYDGFHNITVGFKVYNGYYS